MTGILRKRCGMTLFTTLCACLIIQRIEGYPRQWPTYWPYEKQLLVQESMHKSGDSTSVAEDSEDAVGTPSESETVRYSEPLLAKTSQRVTAIIQQATSYDESAISFPGEDTDSSENFNDDKDEEDRNHDDADDAETDYNNTYTKTSMEHVGPIINNRYSDNDTGKTVDDIIKEAMMEQILLSPEQLEVFKHNHDDSSEYPNKDNSRSPETNPNQNDINTQINVNFNTHDDGIVFPDDERLNKRAHAFFNKPVPSCEGSTFCETVPYYPPADILEIALRKNNITPVVDPVSSTISQRMNRPEDPVICKLKSKPEIIPKSGLDANNEWRYIVNNGTYEQKLQVEICENENVPCGHIVAEALGYETYCEQKYIYRSLVVFSLNDSMVETTPIKIPANCCCNIRQTFDSSIRLRSGISSAKCAMSPVRDRDSK